MSIQLFTDISADLPLSYTREHDITVLPIMLTLNGTDYAINNDPSEANYLNWHACYDAVRAGAPVKTAQITLETFRERFSAVLQQGDDIVYSSFSSGLSGTYNTACLVAQELMQQYPGRQVRVVDSLSASLGHGLLVYLAAQKRDAGASLDELEAYINETRYKCIHWFTVDDLKHLYRGGRVTAASAIVGGVLNIKPVLNVDDEGHLIPKEKMQGTKRAMKALLDHMDATWDRNDAHPIFFGHGDVPEEAQIFVSLLEKRFGRTPDIVSCISPVIGSHSGPGTLALFYVSELPRG